MAASIISGPFMNLRSFRTDKRERNTTSLASKNSSRKTRLASIIDP
jgi:hypothetical protein